jgi:hypothetical protein
MCADRRNTLIYCIFMRHFRFRVRLAGCWVGTNGDRSGSVRGQRKEMDDRYQQSGVLVQFTCAKKLFGFGVFFEHEL